jgi:glucosamine--fructose-6-phosphate aminotransferase (isomerizing)
MNLSWKGGYDHFMLKEIYEQPSVIKDTHETSCEWRSNSNGRCRDNLEKILNADQLL